MQHGLDKGDKPAHVVAGGEFRHYTPVYRMHIHLAVQSVGKQPPFRIVDGNTCLITGGFYTEYPHFDPVSGEQLLLNHCISCSGH